MKISTGILLSTLCLGFFFSCKTKVPANYYLKDRWQVKALPYSTLKNNPKKVVEFFYRAIEDINSNPLPTHGSYESFKFNDSGDVVEYTFHLSAQKTFTVTSKYTGTGYEQFMKDQSTQGFEEKLVTDLQPDSNGSFKLTEWFANDGRRMQLVNYLRDGNEIRQQYQETDTGGNKIFTAAVNITLLYDGQRLLKQKIVTTGSESKLTSEKEFKYDISKHLISIVSNFAGNISTTYFTNNEHGDPVQMINIENNDTTENYVRSFLYDKKGNWIRMLEKELKGPKTPAGASPYILINREIFY